MRVWASANGIFCCRFGFCKERRCRRRKRPNHFEDGLSCFSCSLICLPRRWSCLNVTFSLFTTVVVLDVATAAWSTGALRRSRNHSSSCRSRSMYKSFLPPPAKRLRLRPRKVPKTVGEVISFCYEYNLPWSCLASNWSSSFLRAHCVNWAREQPSWAAVNCLLLSFLSRTATACSFSAMDHCRLFLLLDPVDERCSLVEGDGVVIVVIVIDDEVTGEE